MTLSVSRTVTSGRLPRQGRTAAPTPAPRRPRRPPPRTRGPGLERRRLLGRAGAAGPGLTSLLLAEEEAALGVGERCRVTRAMAAARLKRAAEASG